MDICKPLMLASALPLLLLLCGGAQASSPKGDFSADTAAASDSRAAQCDSVSFATGSARNRAACRRQFAREARPDVQASPLTASDYAS